MVNTSGEFNSTHMLCTGADCLNQLYTDSNRVINSTPVMEFTKEGTLTVNWLVLLLTFVVIGGVMGNVLVCIAICMERKLQNVTNYFLMSLSVADLLVCIIVMPLCIINEFVGYWPFDLVLCDIWQSSDVMLCTSSIMHMCCISLDRYLGIRYPLKNRNKSKTVVGVKIATVWLISVAIASPIIFLSVVDEENVLQGGVCGIFNNYFLIYGSLAAFFIPLIIMIIALSLTIHKLKVQANMCAKDSKKGVPAMRRSISRCSSNRVSMTQKLVVGTPTSTHKLLVGKQKRLSTDSKETSGEAESIKSKDDRKTSESNVEDDEESTVSHRTPLIPKRTLNSILNASSAAAASGTHQPLHNGSAKTNPESTVVPRFQTLVKKHKAAIQAASILIAKNKESATKRQLATVKTEQKAVKVLGTVFAIFVVCWAPFFSLNFANGICDTCEISVIIFKVCLWLGYVSSTLNPIIYTIFNRNFRRAFYRILCCKFRMTKRKKTGSTIALNGVNCKAAKLDSSVESHLMDHSAV